MLSFYAFYEILIIKFSNILPKEYRHNPAKAFRSHRARQEIRKFQGKEKSGFVPKMLFVNMLIFCKKKKRFFLFFDIKF